MNRRLPHNRVYQIIALALIAITVLSWSTASADGLRWVATWSTSPSNPPIVKQRHKGYDNQTIRQIVHISIGGKKVRVRFSNVDGTQPLQIGAARIALHDSDSSILPASDREITFGGKGSVTIPPGAPILSDAVNLDVPSQSDLAISVYIPDKTGPPTSHATALQTNYVSESGDFTKSVSMSDSTKLHNWNFISAVEVSNREARGVVVAVGDSITDGSGSTTNANSRWPDHLARRFASHSKLKKLGVVNAGIGGNRVLNDTPPAIPGFGLNLLSRLEQDVLSITGITHIIVLEGINDIGFSAQLARNQNVTAEELIQGYKQVIARGHARGLKVFGATLPPFKGAGYFSTEGEGKRLTINDWIRTSEEYDGWFDFDAATRDDKDPSRMRPEFTRDNLHPNDAGYKAMADIIDLSVF